MPKLMFRDDLIESLKDPKEARGYLEVALEDGDPDTFLMALKDVADAMGGMTAIAKKSKLHRTGLYRFFSKRGNPTYRNLRTVLEALGYRFKLEKV